MENQVITIQNVRGYLDEQGTAWLNIEDVARGLGFTQIKSGVEYVRWETVNGYLNEFGFSQLVGKGKYIPENMFYRLAMKAKNAAAEQFQAKVADEILPSIRKHGAYLTVQAAEKILYNPDFIIKLAEQVKQAQLERDQFKALADEREVTINELKPKADYCALILQSDEALPTRTIADDYGWSAQHLNNVLKDFGIIYKAGKSWLVKQAFRGRGYTVKIPSVIKGGHTVTNTYWTQKGRMFIYTFLKQRGVLPLCERDENLPALF